MRIQKIQSFLMGMAWLVEIIAGWHILQNTQHALGYPLGSHHSPDVINSGMQSILWNSFFLIFPLFVRWLQRKLYWTRLAIYFLIFSIGFFAQSIYQEITGDPMAAAYCTILGIAFFAITFVFMKKSRAYTRSMLTGK